MAILMDHTAANGAKGNYFRILKIDGICYIGEPVPRFEIWVGFFASQEVRAEHRDALVNYRINVPFKDMQADPRTGGMASFYSVIKNYPPFAGNAIEDIIEDSSNLELDVIKAMKKDEINKAWLAANNSYFMYLGKRIACDEIGHQNIMSTNGQVLLCGTFPKGWPNVWKTMDTYPNESYVPIETIDDWRAFYQAMTDQGAQNYGRAQILKQFVNTTTAANQVAVVNWNADLTTFQLPDPILDAVPQQSDVLLPPTA